MLRWLLITVYTTEYVFSPLCRTLESVTMSSDTFSIIIKEHSLSSEMFQWNILLLCFMGWRIMIVSQLNDCLFFCLLEKLSQSEITQNVFLFLKSEWNNVWLIVCHPGSFFNVLSKSYPFKLVLMLQDWNALQSREQGDSADSSCLVAWHIVGVQWGTVQPAVDCEDWEWSQRSQHQWDVWWTTSKDSLSSFQEV